MLEQLADSVVNSANLSIEDCQLKEDYIKLAKEWKNVVEERDKLKEQLSIKDKVMVSMIETLKKEGQFYLVVDIFFNAGIKSINVTEEK